MRNNKNVSGMNRTGFVRAVGAGAMGIAGAAMFGSNVVSAQSAGKTNWKIGILVRSSTIPSNVQSLEQMKMVLDAAGVEYAPEVYMQSDLPYKNYGQFDQGYEAAKYLVKTEYCNALLGISLSAQSTGIVAYTAENPVPYIECYGTADGNNKRYFHRTTTTSSAWGILSASLVSSSPVNVYGYSKPGDGFADDAFIGWEKTFPTTMRLEASVTLFVPANQGPLPFVYDGYYWTNIGSTNVKIQVLPDTTKAYVVVVPIGTDPETKAVFEYLSYLLPQLPEQVVLIGSHGGKTWLNDYIISSRLIAIQPHWDVYSEGFNAWKSFTGMNEGDLLWDKTLRAFDAALLLAGGLVGSTTPNEVHFTINAFSSPLGSPLYPDEINKLMRGNSSIDMINYEGASGPCDMILGECLTMPFIHYAGPQLNKVIWQ